MTSYDPEKVIEIAERDLYLPTEQKAKIRQVHENETSTESG